MLEFANTLTFLSQESVILSTSGTHLKAFSFIPFLLELGYLKKNSFNLATPFQKKLQSKINENILEINKKSEIILICM